MNMYRFISSQTLLLDNTASSPNGGIRAGSKLYPAIADAQPNPVVKRLRRAAGRVFGSQTLLFFESEAAGKPLEQDSGVSVEIYHGRAGMPAKVEAIARPRAGELLCVIFYGNAVAGFAYASFQDSPAASVMSVVRVPVGTVHLYKACILPQFRHLELLSPLLSEATREILAMGFCRMIVTTTLHEGDEIRDLRRAGFRLFRCESSYRLMNREIYHRSWEPSSDQTAAA